MPLDSRPVRDPRHEVFPDLKLTIRVPAFGDSIEQPVDDTRTRLERSVRVELGHQTRERLVIARAIKSTVPNDQRRALDLDGATPAVRGERAQAQCQPQRRRAPETRENERSYGSWRSGLLDMDSVHLDFSLGGNFGFDSQQAHVLRRVRS